MSARRVQYRAGDVFCIPLPNQSFAYGRILLDVFRLRRRKVFARTCALNDIYGSGLLVQLYRRCTAVPLTDAAELRETDAFLEEFLAHDQVLRGEHAIVGHRPVEPADVDFPEYVTIGRPDRGEWRCYFQKGGVVAELTGGWRGLLRGVLRGIGPEEAARLPRGSYGLGINAELLLKQIGSPTGVADRAREDLRVSPHRRRILRLAGLNPKMTYDEMAARAQSPSVRELLTFLRSD